ncbi:BnaC05g29090D [Brassica napus]|uniref:BnaC05g29090D protein n=1 Tax=Brassica napus TaxID=3708 RepID=A0A078GXJ2_BRANA|nr:BnaC05g29090D [Brassica napus]
MLYVYIINIFIYLGIRSVLGSVPVRFGYFGYKNIGTIRVFEGISPVPVLGISVRFRFGSSVPVILARPNRKHTRVGYRPQLILLLRNHTRSQEADNGKLTQGRRRDTPLNFKHPRRDDKGRDPSSLKTSRRNQIESSENQTPTEFVPLQTRSRKSITANSQRDHHQRLAKETQAEGKSMSINGKESKLQRPANKTLEDKEEMERGKRCYRRGSRNLSHQRTTISDLPDLRTTLEVLPSHFKDKQLEKQKCRGDTHRPDRRWQGKPNRRPVSEIFVNKVDRSQRAFLERETTAFHGFDLIFILSLTLLSNRQDSPRQLYASDKQIQIRRNFSSSTQVSFVSLSMEFGS